MAPSPDTWDPGLEDGASLAGPRLTQATPLCCPPIPAPPPSTQPHHLHPQGRGQVQDSAPRGVQSEAAAAQSRNLPRLPAVAMGTGRRSYGGRRDPNSFSPPRFLCGSPAATSSSQSPSAGIPAVTEPKWRIPAATRLGRLLRRLKRKTEAPGATIRSPCDFRRVTEPGRVHFLLCIRLTPLP